MGTRIFVGNLSFGSTEDAIGRHFEQLGFELRSARIILDRETGRSRGFAFVELADEAQLQEAVRQADGSLLEGRPLAVREAHDKPGPGPGAGPRQGGFGGPRPSFGSRSGDSSDAPGGIPPRENMPRREGGGGYGGGGYGGGGGGYGGGGGGYGGGGYGGGGGGYGGGGGGYGGGGGGYGGGPGGPGPDGGGHRPAPRNFGPPASPSRGKPKPREKEREGDARRGDESKRRRGFHGGRGYTDYEDDDD